MIEREGSRCLVRGPVNHGGVSSLLAEGERLFEGGRLVFDFSAAQAEDSSALSLMLEWVRRAAARNTRVEFAGLDPVLLSLIELYGLAELIPLAAE
jgi:phospholipid transport system transporter-binding protein